MKQVLLINQDKIPHYRVPVYNYLSKYLEKEDFFLTVSSGGVEDGNPHPVEFNYREISLSFISLTRLMLNLNPDVIIFWVNLKYLYLFPTLVLTKMLRKKAIYWGHGRDLRDRQATLKNAAYTLEHWICDAIILYAGHLRKYVHSMFHDKVFIANNTLNMVSHGTQTYRKDAILAKYHIKTPKNIICMGRMQKRKKLEDLLMAFDLFDRKQFGLILIGPDMHGILREVQADNIYKFGPIYGEERLALLSAADVFCLPGAIGLSIVDAFFCGLPIVTEQGEESPEIMYLRDGVNGFIVPKGDIQQLAAKLQLLLEDDVLRAEFSQAARNEIMTNGHIDNMCRGFSDALRFVCDSWTTPS